MSFAAPDNIVVLAREHIGDLICTTPALRSLRTRFPDARITVEVGERAACVLANNPHVDEVILRPSHQGLAGKLQFVRFLRRRQFDLGVVCDSSPDMFLYLWAGGVKRRAGLVRKRRFARLLTDPVAFDPDAHAMIANFRNVVRQLGADITDPSTEVFPTEQDRTEASRQLTAAGIGSDETIIALNPGASLPSNRWPAERFAELGDLIANRMDARILLLGGPEDLALADSIAARMNAAPARLTGRLTVLQLAEVLRQCSIVVTGDTGPMHLAVAMKTTVLALFGPAEPHESGPGYVPGNSVIRKVTACTDCTKQVCRHNRRCMTAITAEEVADRLGEILRSKRDEDKAASSGASEPTTCIHE